LFLLLEKMWLLVSINFTILELIARILLKNCEFFLIQNIVFVNVWIIYFSKLRICWVFPFHLFTVSWYFLVLQLDLKMNVLRMHLMFNCTWHQQFWGHAAECSALHYSLFSSQIHCSYVNALDNTQISIPYELRGAACMRMFFLTFTPLSNVALSYLKSLLFAFLLEILCFPLFTVVSSRKKLSFRYTCINRKCRF
jgi:hypothetical protein